MSGMTGLALLLPVLVFSILATPFARAGDVVQPRAGLNNVFLKLWRSERGEKDANGQSQG